MAAMTSDRQEDTPAGAVADNSTVEGKVTPLPLKQMTALALVLMSESICSTMLLPFVGLFATHLQGYEDTNKAGRITGLMVGSFMFGQVVSSKLWGLLSDTYGRRLPLIVGLFAGGWAMFFFGLSPNVYVCCLLRLVHGFFNGNILVAKTMIADITDKTNEAKGFALVSITWGTGSLFGPAIGGFLYGPAHNPKLQWMHVSESSFLGRHPAFLPSVVLFLYAMGSLMVTVLVLKETNVHRKPLSSAKPVQFLARHLPCLRHLLVDGAAAAAPRGGPARDVVVVNVSAEGPTRERRRRKAAATVEGDGISPRAGAQRSTNATAGETGAVKSADEKSDTGTEASTDPPRIRKLSYAQAMGMPPIRNITLFYVLLSASDMTYCEILPLWGVATADVGGLAFFSDTVALIMLVCSIPTVVANLGFHRMCMLLRSNYVRFWIMCMIIYTTGVVLVPLGNRLDRAGRLVYLIAMGAIRQVGVSWGYSLIHMLTAKAAPLGCIGAVYGISQSFASMTRCVIPIIIAPVFAWSISKVRPFPFNYYLLFLFSCACSLAGLALSLFCRTTRNAEDDRRDAEIARAEAAKRRARAARTEPTSVDRLPGLARAGRGDGDAEGGDEADNDVDVHDDSDDDDDAGGAYLSLLASFCTNPVGDAYVPVARLQEMCAETPATGEPTPIGEKHTCPPQSPAALESPPIPLSSPTDPARVHVIRATTQRLLHSLRTQQVESRRFAELSSGAADGAHANEEEDELPGLPVERC